LLCEEGQVGEAEGTNLPEWFYYSANKMGGEQGIMGNFNGNELLYDIIDQDLEGSIYPGG
jgi:hypothetical protein